MLLCQAYLKKHRVIPIGIDQFSVPSGRHYGRKPLSANDFSVPSGRHYGKYASLTNLCHQLRVESKIKNNSM